MPFAMRLGIYVVSIIFTSLAMPSAALRHDEGNDLGISCKVVKSPNTIHFASSLSMFTSQVASCFDWDPRAKLSSIQETALRKCIADTSKAILWDYEDDVGVAVGSEASVNEGKEYTLLKCNKYVVELWLKK